MNILWICCCPLRIQNLAEDHPYLYWVMSGMLPGGIPGQNTVSGNGNNGLTSVDEAEAKMRAEQGNADANKDENSRQGN